MSSVLWVRLFARYSLAAGFLSAVADRFGFWGPPGAEGVVWGSFAEFLAYTGQLNPYVPEEWLPVLGGVVSFFEVAVALALLLGWRQRWAGLAAGLLLLSFGLAMSLTTGLKSALDASVFAAAAAGFLLSNEPGQARD